MSILPPCDAPAAYIPFTAIACPDAGNQSIPVGPGAPLPVETSFGPATSTAIAGTASASMIAGPFIPQLGRPIWLTLDGTWSGTVCIKRSTDGGTTSHGLTVAGEAWAEFSQNANEAVAIESSTAATYYLDIVLASGSLTYEVAQ